MTNRRAFLGTSVAVAASAMGEDGEPSLAFGNRAHWFVRPAAKEKLIWSLSTVLGCGEPASLKAQGIAEPILAWRFPGGGSVSVEFTEDALDESQARRGPWLEVWSSDPGTLKKKILASGLTEVHYAATNTFYFALPGGQILGIVSGRNPSAGEMKK